MSWKDKKAQADVLFEKAKAIIEKGAEATSEEKENLEQMLEDARAFKAEALQLHEIEAALAETKTLPHLGDQTPGSPFGPADPPKERPEEKDKPFGDWGAFLYAAWLQEKKGIPDARLRWFKDEDPEGHEGKAMAGNVGARGGFLIPTEFLPQLQAVMAEEAIVRSMATVIRMAGRQLSLPVLDQTGTTAGSPHWFGGMKFYWADEAQEKTETNATFRRVNLVAKKLIGYTNASDELLDDSAISLGDFLSGPLGFAGGIAWMEDYAFLRGTGGGQPRGVVNAPATLAPARAAAGAVGYVDCITMLSQFLPSGRGAWIVSQSVMASLIQMSGPAGNASYVWQPSARDGVPGYLFGLPVYWTEKLPVLGTRGDILLADFRYFVVGDRQATTIESSTAPRWIYDETSWRAVHRVDGQPWLSSPLTYQDGATQVSPFVVLGAASS